MKIPFLIGTTLILTMACGNPPGVYYEPVNNADASAYAPSASGSNTGGQQSSISSSTLPDANLQSMSKTVYFAEDRSELSPQAKAILDAQARALQSASGEFLIEGHADEQGTREYNIALGARRAASVKEYLVSQGVPSWRLKTISYGKERPVETCSEERCWSKNRRAVTVVQ